ncbi:DUF3331 domain-containing protein (plasmid) [Pararobbsia alpina]|uniref:DUF3331 domain-containing protein n=1 Tax=Pararobbsia alpina TaxID=621374 RepID=UPI0039A5A126
MPPTRRTSDPWRHAVTSLMLATAWTGADDSDVVRWPSVLRKSPADARAAIITSPRPSLTVRVIERLSHCTVAVSWHDTTACRYDDQVWRAGVARRCGVCALSAVPIVPGDAVYRPVNTSRAPVNDGAMILATHMEHLEDETDAVSN